MTHWHAYTYTGPARPPDRDARDPHSATPPLVIGEWLAKPRSMLAGTFAAADDAIGWLTTELTRTPPLPTAVTPELVLAYARDRLAAHPYDQVTRYYTATAYACRDLIHCAGAGRCPEPR